MLMRERERELLYLFIVFAKLDFNKIEFYVAFFQLPPGIRHRKLNFNDIKFYVELDFSKIKFQNKDISLNSLKRGTNYYIFCKLGANAHFSQAFYEKLKVDKI